MSVDRIGFLGLGTMGRPMSVCLLDAGFEVSGFDANTEALGNADPRLRPVASPAEAAAGAGIVVAMLPSGVEVGDAVLGEAGAAENMPAGAVMLDCSSSQPWLTRELASKLDARGVALVDAPVSGARVGAEAGALTFMVGGAIDAVTRCRPALDAMGANIFHVGPVGSGHVVKSVNNLMTAMSYLVTAEALSIGVEAGVDPEQMIDLINLSTGMNQLTLNQFKPRVLSRRFDSGFALDLMAKDVGIAMELAARAGLSLPFSEAGAAEWIGASAVLGPGRNIAEIVRLVEDRTGVTLASTDAATEESP